MEKHPLYSRIASVYDLGFSVLLDQGNRWACRELAESGAKRILEVGIGTGFSIPHYQAGSDVTGIDLNPSMLSKARERASKRSDLNLKLSEMDAQRLEFADESFDAVWMPSVLTVVPDARQAVAEAYRVLKPGGPLIAISHFVEESRWPALLRKAFDPITQGLFGFHMNLSKSIFEGLPGLHIERVEPTNYLAWTVPLSFMVIARKG